MDFKERLAALRGQPSAREAFLVSALATVGITGDQITAAADAKDAQFLGALWAGDMAKAQGESETKAREATSQLDAIRVALASHGVPKDAAIDKIGDAIKGAIETASTKKAAQDLASRGHVPHTDTPSTGSGSTRTPLDILGDTKSSKEEEIAAYNTIFNNK